MKTPERKNNVWMILLAIRTVLFGEEISFAEWQLWQKETEQVNAG